METPSREVVLTSSTGTPAAAAVSQQQVLWHVFEFCAEDSNGDGLVTAKDRRSLGIASATGHGFAIVIPQLDDIFAEALVDQETLSIIHGTQSQQVVVRIDLPNRRVVSTKSLPDFLSR
jgi:hypothetical protein